LPACFRRGKSDFGAPTETLALDAELPPRRSWHPVVIVSGQEADCIDRFIAQFSRKR